MARELNYESPYGGTAQVMVEVGSYLNNNSLYVGLSSKDGEDENYYPYCDATVNLEGYNPANLFEQAVKDYSENEGMGEFLIKNGIAAPTGKYVKSGYASIPVYRFSEEKLAELDPEGCKRLTETIGEKPAEQAPTAATLGVAL